MFCVSFEYFTFDFATKNETSINRLLSSHCLYSSLNFLAIILTLHGNFPRKVLEVFFIVSKVSHFGRYIICCTSQWIWTQSMFSKDKEYWLIDSDNKLMALAQSQYHSSSSLVYSLSLPHVYWVFTNWARHLGVWSQMGLSSTKNASRGDRIPAKLFQILKDDAVKVLYSICHQIWKTHSTVATGLEKVSFHSSPKERQCQRMLKLLNNCTHFTC